MPERDWESVIGLEVHCQLSSASKIFSDAPAGFAEDPNSQACEVDLALPGTLPVLNRDVVEKAMRFGMAVGAEISRSSEFARKNYFYPDLPKGYQISQYEHPILTGGSVEIDCGDGVRKTVRLVRAHLEEDAGKLLHEIPGGRSGVDLNRAGTPLLEIVSEPDLRSAAEAVDYAKRLHQLVRYLGICDGNMQHGSLRCDANVSVRPKGSETLGTRAEIKNLNSFRYLQQAIDHEIARQVALIEGGGEVAQETRLFNPGTGKTREMRSKEEAHDYRYFPDPDLLPLEIGEEWIGQVRSAMPELPWERKARYVSELGLGEYDAGVLTADPDLAEYFDRAVAALGKESAKLCANWVAGDLSAHLNRSGLGASGMPVSPERLAGLLRRVADSTVSGPAAKAILEEMWEGTEEADAIIERKGLRQITDTSELEKVVDAVIEGNPDQFRQLCGGKERLLGYFVGQAMKATKGKGNPALIGDIVKGRVRAEGRNPPQ